MRKNDTIPRQLKRPPNEWRYDLEQRLVSTETECATPRKMEPFPQFGKMPAYYPIIGIRSINLRGREHRKQGLKHSFRSAELIERIVNQGNRDIIKNHTRTGKSAKYTNGNK